MDRKIIQFPASARPPLPAIPGLRGINPSLGKPWAQRDQSIRGQVPTAPTTAGATNAALERALFLAEAEYAWATATVPQAAPVTARAVY